MSQELARIERLEERVSRLEACFLELERKHGHVHTRLDLLKRACDGDYVRHKYKVETLEKQLYRLIEMLLESPLEGPVLDMEDAIDIKGLGHSARVPSKNSGN